MSPDPAGSHDRDVLVAMLSIALDRNAGQPLVEQLYRHVRELILTQRLAAGARLPSTRQLARDLDVSRTVTLDAFGQLAVEGFLESRQGAGHFVAHLDLTDAPAALGGPNIIPDGQDELDSATGLPFDPSWQAVELFPAQIWNRMLGRGWRRHWPSAVERHWAGLPALRAALAEHLHALRGVPLSAEQVMVTSGNADTLTLITRALARRCDRPLRTWVEDPGYVASSSLLRREGFEPVAVPVDSDGLQIDAGERLALDAVMAMVTSTRQFPLGMPLSLSRRLALLEWARRSGAVIVDDDYDGEIRFTGRALQSLANLDPQAPVLTIGSFSKLTFPGLRLGYAVGPVELIGHLVDERRESQALVPTSAQAAFAEFVSTGGFARHLRQLRTYLARRRLMLVQMLLREASDLLHPLPQEVGMHLTVRFAKALSAKTTDVALAQLGRTQGLLLVPLSPQFASRVGEQGFILGYAGWSEAELRSALERLIGLLRAV